MASQGRAATPGPRPVRHAEGDKPLPAAAAAAAAVGKPTSDAGKSQKEAAAAKAAPSAASGGLWELLGSALSAKSRLYLAAKEELRSCDLLMLVEVFLAFALTEFWLRIALPGLGLTSGMPCPLADRVGRAEMFVLGPLGYTSMYACVCGSIHVWYTKLYPEVGRQLSLQSKPMSSEEQQKAIGFSLKSIASTTSLSGYFYHAMRGETNVRSAMPELRELPWFVLAYILIDISAYLVHRTMHRPWWYARVHKVHHLWKSPNVWVVSAIHPAELLMLAVPTMMILTAMPLSLFSTVVFLLWIYVCNTIDHSGMSLEHLPLCRLLFWQAPAEFHDNHHAYFHANYGAMVDWWDRLGGTYYHPNTSGVTLSESQFVSVRELRKRDVVA
eukprot:TRINITY_DN11128_c0_g1_i2.p1 TRINITY_DN11128_c0_g1~~TRINITY_DN11128_c0_g1_i2.p1  ORF type:complete len:402 (-),score=66.19 TRINITY_DN11128_c0_g1_i2:159-1313(-)